MPRKNLIPKIRTTHKTFVPRLRVHRKTSFLRVRCDAELYRALNASADHCDRRKADQARYILRLALGLNVDEEADRISTRVKPFKNHLR